MTKKSILLFLALVVLLTCISLWRALSFQFWRDDWGDTWLVLYHLKDFLSTSAAAKLHPGSGIEKYLLSQIFQTNPFPWQVTGLVFRVISAISVSLMMLGITGSKKTAFISGILFAPLLIGLESYVWISAHTSAIFIIFFCIGVYFWISSEKNKSILYTISGFFVLLISFTVSPARGIIMLALLPLWDILSFFILPTKKTFKYILVRNIIFFILVFFLLQILNQNGTFTFSSFQQKILNSLVNINLIRNFLASIGNGTFGWLIPVPESGSLTNPDSSLVIGGVIFCCFIIFSVIGFLIKRNNFFKILSFFSVWVILFYLPNWFFDQGLSVGGSHRYLTISSVGVVGIFGYLFGAVKSKWYLIFTVAFVLLNIIGSRRILEEQYMYRSRQMVDPLWARINKDVPKSEKGDIFMYEGSDNLRGVALDWSFSIPFVLKRKLASQEDTPIATGDRKLIQQLLCEDNIPRPAIGAWVVQKKRIPLSHLYAWNLTNGIMTNISLKERATFAKVDNPSEPDCAGVPKVKITTPPYF